MREFYGKTAVITGGASGIGLAIAERCAKEGMNIVLADIEKKALAEAKTELEKTGVKVLAIRTDVSKAEDIEILANKTLEEFGQIHLLFNNAGVGSPGTTWELSLNDWKWVLDVNLWGVIHGVRVFTPLMLKQNTMCHIVNTASMAGLGYYPYMGNYAVSKFGIVSLSESLFFELQDLGSKIRVSVLCPSFVKTRLVDAGRNRPIGVESSSSMSLEALERMKYMDNALEKSSMSAEKVADIVFQAIKEERFYIITHKDSFAEIENRMNNILQERKPTLS